MTAIFPAAALDGDRTFGDLADRPVKCFATGPRDCPRERRTEAANDGVVEEEAMRKPYGRRLLLALGLLAGLAGTAAAQPATPAGAPPVFSPTGRTAWVGIGIGAFLPVPGSPKPIGQDPAHPYISNDESGVTGKQPTQRISDIGNPNLKQWAKDVMKQDDDAVLKGRFAFTARSSCRAAGVPGFDVLLGGALSILQSPREVTMIFSGNAEVRHIHLDAPHSANPKPSWYGESVGRYEGDTLWRLIEDGKKLEILITIDDPDTFNQPWQALRQYDRVNRNWAEDSCSENNINPFGIDYGTPVAAKPDF
jgi:hypothetical protein